MNGLKMADSADGIVNSIAYSVLLNDNGKVWAIECFNVYAKRHECINLYEAVAYNTQERIQEIVSALVKKGE